MTRPSFSDAVTHSDAFPLYNPIRAHTRAHAHVKPLYRKERHCASLRHSDDVADLVIAVQRLTPDRRDPERFHIEKSEIVAALRRLAKEMAR